jgi:hypothetical protein
MATSTVKLPEDVKALAEARAAELGYADVGEYVARLIRGEVAGGPDGLTIDSDAQLEALLHGRADGPWVDVDAADFKRMRAKLEARLDRSEGRP